MAYIDREKFIDIMNAKADMSLGTPKAVFHSVAKMLEAIPTADVVEVVRCKDCISCHEYQDFFLRKYLGCLSTGKIEEVKPTHFCSYGKRRQQ